MIRGGAALIGLAIVGCASTPPRVSLEPPAQAPPASAYVDELKKWTRHGHILADFDEALTVDATLMSPELAAAYASRWIKVYQLNETDAAAFRAKLESRVADVWELHIESSTHRADINELGPRGPWRITLVDDRDRAVTPIEVRLEKTPRDVSVEMFPYATIFSRPWTVRFPRLLPDGTALADSAKWIALRIAGPAGHVDLKWVLR